MTELDNVPLQVGEETIVLDMKGKERKYNDAPASGGGNDRESPPLAALAIYEYRTVNEATRELYM
jgi:hypothetical protein